MERKKSSSKTGVSMLTKVSYAGVNFALELQATIWALFALHFMTSNAKMEPSLAGWVAILYRVWDALNDPVVGNLSDRTQSERWGRRRGWMLCGIFPFAIAYFCMWYVPFGPENQIGLFGYFLVVKMVSDIGYTCVNVPHLAMLNDITQDYHERFQINSMRTIGIALGSLLSMVMVAVLSHFIKDEQSKFLVLAGITGTISILSVCNCVYQTRKYKNGVTSNANTYNLSFFERFRKVFSVKAAALSIGIFVFSASTTQTTLAIATYYIKDYLLMSDLKLVTVILTAQVVGIATALVVMGIQKKIEKKTIYYGGAMIWLQFYLFISLVNRDNAWSLYILGAIMGVGMATAMLIPIGYVSDSAEFIDYYTGLRLEGTLFGSLHLINKTTVGLAIFAFENILQWTGFSNANKLDLSLQTILALKICFSCIPGGLLLITIIINYFIPINKESSAKVSEVLKERKHQVSEGDSDSVTTSLLEEVNIIEESKGPYVTYFLIDGLENSVYHSLMKENKLPNISNLIEQGGIVKNGVTSFPSITGYAFFPYISGEDASNSGIMGLRWFNRNNKIGNEGVRNYIGKTNKWLNSDLNIEVPTIYEHFAENHSWTIQTYANRGVKTSQILGWPMVSAKFKNFFPFTWFNRIPYFGKRIVYDYSKYETKVFEQAIADLELKPKVQWLTLASTDSCHHVEGTSDNYKECVMNVDSLIGKYVEACKKLNLDEDRIYCVLSDHGVSNVYTNVDVGQMLQDNIGLNVLKVYGSNVWNDTLENSFKPYDDTDLIACLNGNAILYIYLKSPKSTDIMQGVSPWQQRLTNKQILNYPFKGKKVDLVKEIFKADGVDMVFIRSDNHNESDIYSLNGLGRVKYHNNKFSYSVISGTDPIDYPIELHDKPMTPDQWLSVSYNTKYPYAPVRVHRMMYCEASGDLMVTSKVGFDFGKNCEPIITNNRGAHGSLCRDQMIVPMIVKGPGIIPGSSVETARAEDFGATVLDLCGIQTSTTGEPIKQLLSNPDKNRLARLDVSNEIHRFQ